LGKAYLNLNSNYKFDTTAITHGRIKFQSPLVTIMNF